MRAFVAIPIALVLAGVLACSSTLAPTTGTSGSPDGVDAGPSGSDTSPTFLAPNDYASLLRIDERFPFGVTRKLTAGGSTPVTHARWGNHGGPMVTTGTYGASGSEPLAVTRWALPDTASGAAPASSASIDGLTGLPAQAFYGADGMVDLPFGPFSLLTYTTPGKPYLGEAILYRYATNYSAIVGRARANGIYSAVAVTHDDATRQRIVYSGLSPLASDASSTNDNGLYLAALCNGTLTVTAPCAAPVKLCGWSGQSGPVAVDAHGNAFVAASLLDAKSSDAVFGISKPQIDAAVATTSTTLAEENTNGTTSLVALAPDAGGEGWVVVVGADTTAPASAASFVEKDGSLTKGASALTAALTKGADASDLAVFGDPGGHLWIAVTTAKSGGFFFELERTLAP